jgi:hypothetical protein
MYTLPADPDVELNVNSTADRYANDVVFICTAA